MLDPLLNGNYNCTQSLNTICTAECDQGYEIAPKANNSTTCLADATWTLPLPCCVRKYCSVYCLKCLGESFVNSFEFPSKNH